MTWSVWKRTCGTVWTPELSEEHGFPLAWMEVMHVVSTTPGCRVLDVAEALFITVGGASKVVDKVETAGWCRRLPNPNDGRSNLLELTASGRQVLAVQPASPSVKPSRSTSARRRQRPSSASCPALWVECVDIWSLRTEPLDRPPDDVDDEGGGARRPGTARRPAHPQASDPDTAVGPGVDQGRRRSG